MVTEDDCAAHEALHSKFRSLSAGVSLSVVGEQDCPCVENVGAHDSLGPFGVTLAQRRDQLPMVREGALQLLSVVALEHMADQRNLDYCSHYLDQPPVVGCCDDDAVKVVVQHCDVLEPSRRSPPCRGLHPLAEVFEPGDPLLGDQLCRARGSMPLQPLAETERASQVRIYPRRHSRTLVGFDMDKALSREPTQGLADRRPRYPELAGQLNFTQRGTRRVTALDEPLAQDSVDIG